VRSASVKKVSPEKKNKIKNKRFRNMDDYDKLKLEAKANVNFIGQLSLNFLNLDFVF
jgi:hypothetical protein